MKKITISYLTILTEETLKRFNERFVKNSDSNKPMFRDKYSVNEVRHFLREVVGRTLNFGLQTGRRFPLKNED